MHGMLATPVETIQRDHDGNTDVTRLVDLVAEYDVFECVFGLPVNMQGLRTPSTDDAEAFACEVAQALRERPGAAHVSIRLIDERLSTVSAQGQLRQAGKKTKQSRNIIDQAAAVVILQHALDSERAQQQPPGHELECPLTTED